MAKFRFLFMIVAVCGLNISCGKKPGPIVPNAQESNQGEGKLNFSGNWRGVGVNKKEDKQIQNVEFSFDDDGNFKFHQVDSESSTATGTFEQFAGDNNMVLSLKLKDSNISSFGLAGSTLNYTLEMNGDNLRLSQPQLEYLLKRQTGTAPGNSEHPADSDDSDPQLSGIWQCTDKFDSHWALHFPDKATFWALISNAQAQKPLKIAGKINSFDPKTGLGELVVTEDSSTAVDYVGTTLNFTISTTKTMMVSVHPVEKAAPSEFGCYR